MELIKIMEKIVILCLWVFGIIFEIIGGLFSWAWDHLGGIFLGAIAGGFVGYDRGHQEGRKEGYREGCLRGYELGHEEGREEGRG